MAEATDTKFYYLTEGRGTVGDEVGDWEPLCSMAHDDYTKALACHHKRMAMQARSRMPATPGECHMLQEIMINEKNGRSIELRLVKMTQITEVIPVAAEGSVLQ